MATKIEIVDFSSRRKRGDKITFTWKTLGEVTRRRTYPIADLEIDESVKPNRVYLIMKTSDTIWHCKCETDRKLAELLVKHIDDRTWVQLAKHFGKPYPYAEPARYDLVYRLMGCKQDDKKKKRIVLDTYIMTDQPEECRKCQTRALILRENNDGSQIIKCPECQYEYRIVPN